MGLVPVYAYDDDDVPWVFVQGLRSLAVLNISEAKPFLNDVYDVYDGVSWVPYKDMFEKFGRVLNISESELFLKDLIGVCIAGLEAKEAKAL